MTWTAQVTYTAMDLSQQTHDEMVHALGDAGVVYDRATGRLQITLEVDAATLRQAADEALRATTAALRYASAAGKPARLHVMTTADFIAETEHPAALDLVGVAEVAAQLGVSRQRASKLTERPDFPRPVSTPAAGPVYTQASVDAFRERWTATRNPRGGRPRRDVAPVASAR